MTYSPDDYTIARGTIEIAIITNGVIGDYVDLGNSPRFEIQLISDRRVHRESRTADRHIDKAVLVDANYELVFALDQRAVSNLCLFLAANQVGVTTLEADQAIPAEYAIRFTSANRTGPNYRWDFWRCKIQSEQAMSLIEGNSWARLWFRARGMAAAGNSPYFTMDNNRIYATWDTENKSDEITLSSDLLTATFPIIQYANPCVMATLGSSAPFVFELTNLGGVAWQGLGLPTCKVYGTVWRYPGATNDGVTQSWGFRGAYHRFNGALKPAIVGISDEIGVIRQIIWNNNGDVYVRQNGIFLCNRTDYNNGQSLTDQFDEALPVLTGVINAGELAYPAFGQETYGGTGSVLANFGQNAWANDPPEGFEGVYQEI